MSQGLSEDIILAAIDRVFPNTAFLLGRGDDCGIVEASGPIAISSDLFLQDVHFRLEYFTPRQIGHKALAVNLSDLAAMGATPLGFSLCLGIPASLDLPWLEEMLDGMASLASRYRLNLLGGDLSAADKLHISITIYGNAATGAGFLTRRGAQAGDVLFVAGQLGLARIGLAILESGAPREAWPEACQAHLEPVPLVETGLALAVHGEGRVALMDISDGVARDLPRLLKAAAGTRDSPPGAVLTVPAARLHPEVLRYAAAHKIDPAEFALAGGEDYGLLGACPTALWPSLEVAAPGLWRLGEVTRETGIIWNGRHLEPEAGFDHFAR